MAMDTYTVAALEINDVVVAQANQINVDPGIQKFVNSAGGSPDATFIANKSQRPKISVTSHAVKAVLDVTGIGPVAISGTTKVAVYFQKLLTGGFRDTSGHKKLLINAGAIFPRQIQASQDSEATITFDVLATWDGTNLPFVESEVSSLPTGNNVATALRTLGPVKIASSLRLTSSLSIDFGLGEIYQQCSGEVYPREVAAMTRKVVGMVKSPDMLLLDAVTAPGQALTNAIFYFRKVSENGTRVADATAEHIGFTFPSAYAHTTQMSASQGSEGAIDLEIEASDDGTNAPVTLDTTMAVA